MNNLTKFYNSDNLENNDNLYLYFTIGENKYAINSGCVVEIMKLPMLEHPQKLPNNIVGLLSYNNFTINVLDIRFYLDIKVTPYSVSNQLLIVKTDESFFGLVINKVEDIVQFEQSKIEHFPISNEDKLIDFLYHKDNDTISVINLYGIENMLKKGVPTQDIDIQFLFPQDDESRYKLMQRNQALIEKSNFNLTKNIFSQDKFISFSINNEIYCINLEFVKEFLKNSVVTPIPCAPDYIAGLMTLRGDFVTVVDTKKFLGLPSGTVLDKNRVIIVESSDYKMGLLVDEIYSIIDIPEELIIENTPNQTDKYIQCELVMEEKLYTILDMRNIFSDERFYIEEII